MVWRTDYEIRGLVLEAGTLVLYCMLLVYYNV